LARTGAKTDIDSASRPCTQWLLRAEGQGEFCSRPASLRGGSPPSFVRGDAADIWWETAPQLHALGLLTTLDIMPFSAMPFRRSATSMIGGGPPRRLSRAWLSEMKRPPAGAGSGRAAINGILGGGQIGYNAQINNWVLGLEADIQATDQRGSVPLFDPVNNVLATVNDKMPWFATFRGRVGIAPEPSRAAPRLPGSTRTSPSARPAAPCRPGAPIQPGGAGWSAAPRRGRR
jgi:hypothetical protein